MVMSVSIEDDFCHFALISEAVQFRSSVKIRFLSISMKLN